MYFFAADSSSLISLYFAFVKYLPTALPYSFFIFLLSPAWHTLHFASANAAFLSPGLYFATHSLLNGGSAEALCMLQASATSNNTRHAQTFFISILRLAIYVTNPSDHQCQYTNPSR